MQLERTLDETYYPGLSAPELQDRNDDQVISSKFRDESGKPKNESPMLIVPQLWLWRSKELVISAHSFTQGLKWFKRVEEVKDGKKVQVWQPSLGLLYTNGPLLQMGRLLAACIEAFGKEEVLEYEGRTHTFAPALDLFESRVVSVLSEVKTYMEDAKRNTIDFDKERHFHHTISDVRSELVMIKYVLSQQQQILSSLLEERADNIKAQPQPETPDETSAWKVVHKAKNELIQYQERVKKIDGDAERIGTSVQDMLNLKRTYASVQDSHASVLLSTAAIGFAIITIIFTPLAFLTALFALDIQGFDKLRVKSSSAPATAGSNGDSDSQIRTANSTTPDDDKVYSSAKMSGIFGKRADLKP